MDKSVEQLPLVSVNMIVYNGEKYIAHAIQSILNQTYTNFELIIINDGSTDNSQSIVEQYTDKRIKLYNSSKNQGISKSRNIAVEQSQGKYIAVLDCDDITYPQRLEKQVFFMEQNKEYGLLGGWIKVIDSTGKYTGKTYCLNLDDKLIRTELFFRNYFFHSTVMMRSNMLPNNPYNNDYPPAEDYFLWTQIAEKHKVGNLKEFLSDYRVHNESITNTKKTTQIKAEKEIITSLTGCFLNKKITDSTIDLHYSFLYQPASLKKDIKTVINTKKWLLQLLKHNSETKYYDSVHFKHKIYSTWNSISTTSYLHGVRAITLIDFLPRYTKKTEIILFLIRCFWHSIKLAKANKIHVIVL